MKFYRGSGKAARAYVESDHHRADDYYLAEGSGIAQLISIRGATGEVLPAVGMDGDTYEQWVEGTDIATGLPKGRIRQDEHALRFAEVVINGPKSWSLAAGLHPDISTAYEAAQDKAVEEIGRYVAANACTRLGPRGGQVQVHVDNVEMAAIRHYTSRAGDPHRHIHLQFNARVPVGEKWRGIDSAAMLRMQRAINGIGHRAIVADPEFRATLAAHGYTLDPSGEIVQLASIVPAMSKRSTQVAENVARYEREWRAANPGAEPSAEQIRSWDTRGWEDARPAKAKNPTRGAECEQEWVTELRALGVDLDAHQSAAPAKISGITVGSVNRNDVATRALAVLGSGARGRSTWCTFDIRGCVEEVLSKVDVVGDRAGYREMAEDISSRVLERCLSVVDRPDVPEHIRHLTSEAVIALREDITGRLAVRGATVHQPAGVDEVGAALARMELERGEPLPLDEGQVAAVRALTGTGPLVFVEGAAGAGKTSMLAAAREVAAAQGRNMRVVAPTKKAATVAAEEIGTDSNTAAGLAYAHGFRWDDDGLWTRLAIGETDARGFTYRGPRAADRLHEGDVLVIDEAGMLDQQTARALLHIADEAGANLAYVGDRRQLPAVGIGGVLDIVSTWTPQHIELASIHRFRRNVPGDDGELVNVPDTQYAALSLDIRSGIDPGAVFDRLLADGHVQLWDSDAEALGNLALTVADRHTAGESQAVSVATNDEASLLNGAVHEQLLERGLIDTTVTVNGSDGLEIGVGDRVMTRQNDAELDVANRQVWTVTGITDAGHVKIAGDNYRHTTLEPDYVRESLHLAYATTGYGVQGETATHGDVLVSMSTDAAGAYVGLTRGRHSNTAHFVADTVDQAREQWIEASGRNRADLGLDQARNAARNEARNYRETPAQSDGERSTAAVEHTPRRPRRVAGTRRLDPERRSFADRMREIAAEADTRVDINQSADEFTPAVSDYDLDERPDQHRQTGPHL
jgi:exodeoxyribonuclease V alpha subunit